MGNRGVDVAGAGGRVRGRTAGWAGGEGSLVRRRRRLGLLGLLGILASLATALPLGGPAAADSNGATVIFLSSDQYNQSIEYGQGVHVFGHLQDLSLSCLSPPFDCDTPNGSVHFTGDEGAIDYGTAGVLPNPYDPEIEYGQFTLDIAPEKFFPGVQYVVMDYTGNFDPYRTFIEVKVSRQRCRGFVLKQSSAGSKPGESVTFTADLGASVDSLRQRTGGITIYEGDQILATTSSIPDGRSFAAATAALPQGSTDLYAVYTGDGYYEGCTSPITRHQVSADAYPTANDDLALVDVGGSVRIPVLDNDFDDGGSIRSEVLTNPDFGDLESSGNDYIYTPDPDMGSYEDSFTYFLYDSIGQSSAPARVAIFVGCTPSPDPDQYGVGESSVLTVPAPGVIGNDDSCDASPVSVDTEPGHGTLALAADGGFTYTPTPGYFGPDRFTYAYTEGLSDPVTETVTIDVRAKVPETTTTTTTSTTTTTTEPTTTTTDPTTTTSTTEPTTTTSTSTTTTTEPTTTTSTSTSTTTTTTPTTTTTTTPPPVLTPSEARVVGWYEALLDRSPDPAGLDHWATKLDNGTRPLSVTSQIVGSGEFTRRIVRDAYRSCLGRGPDASGLAYWANRVARTGSTDDLRIGLLASSEAWSRAGQDPAAWAGWIYDALLDRLPTASERAKVISQLAGGSSRTSVVRSVVTSPGARRHLAVVWYQALLGRPPTVDEALDWADAMALGTQERTLVAELASRLVVPTS